MISCGWNNIDCATLHEEGFWHQPEAQFDRSQMPSETPLLETACTAATEACEVSGHTLPPTTCLERDLLRFGLKTGQDRVGYWN